MDEENIDGTSRPPVPQADKDALRSEGIEIMDDVTPAEKENITPPKPEAPKTLPYVAPQPEVTRAAIIPKFENPLPKNPAPRMEIPTEVKPIFDPRTRRPGDLEAIRTYKIDAEEAVQGNKTSIIDIAVAENKRKEKETPIERLEPRSKGLLWFSIILIILAVIVGGGAYYFYVVGSQTIGSPETSAARIHPPLVGTTEEKTISIDPKNPLPSVGAQIAALSFPVASVVALDPVNTFGNIIATSTDFLSALNISVPSQVSVSLDGTYMLGAIINDPNEPFIILGISSFENAFAGMLTWEKTMRNDLIGFIQIGHPSEPTINLGTESFTDTRIENQDVRELVTASDTPLLLYTFIGSNHLVIATNPGALSTIITELNTTNVIR